MEHFSDRLRRARTLRKLSQAQLGRASGLSQGAISSYETRARKATTELVPLAQALNVNPIWLLTGNGPMEPVADPSTPNPASQVRDVERQPLSTGWPFDSIPEDNFWVLTKPQRRIIEQTVASMITRFRDEQKGLEK